MSKLSQIAFSQALTSLPQPLTCLWWRASSEACRKRTPGRSPHPPRPHWSSGWARSPLLHSPRLSFSSLPTKACLHHLSGCHNYLLADGPQIFFVHCHISTPYCAFCGVPVNVNKMTGRFIYLLWFQNLSFCPRSSCRSWWPPGRNRRGRTRLFSQWRSGAGRRRPIKWIKLEPFIGLKRFLFIVESVEK